MVNAVALAEFLKGNFELDTRALCYTVLGPV